MAEPMCLVDPLLRVNPAALALLRGLSGPLHVVGIFGPKGTGKSFLLGQLAGQENGFGPTPGIWLQWLPHPKRPGENLVLLETEGFQEECEEDEEAVFSRLFCLNVLLCTVFIYNSRVGQDPQRELDRLTCVRDLVHRVCVQEDCLLENSFLLSSVLPDFAWCLRDVASDTVWDEMLEEANNNLAFLLSSSAVPEDSPSCCIQQFFPSQKAFCFRSPSVEESEREFFPLDQLHPIFQKQLRVFRDYVLSRASKRDVSGEVLSDRLKQFVEALSRDQPVLLSHICRSSQGAACWEEERCFLDPPSTQFPRSVPVIEEIPRSSASPSLQVWKEEEEEEEEEEGEDRWRDPCPDGAAEGSLQAPWPPGTSPSVPQASAMEAPMCLIENNPGRELRINPQALRILQNIRKPVVVVAIVGLYRTGKSYLMNRLAGKHSGGFSLGATVQASTKGIWMWCRPHPLRPDHALVLLDTEGLGDVEKSNTENDIWIFALSVLLSSTFVYNSMGTINHYALEQMHYVTELTEHIKMKATDRERSHQREGGWMPNDLASVFPSFVWVVRDFSLQLQLEDGSPITEDEYLEKALERRAGAPEKQDLPKRCIREFFPSRKCFVFDRPVASREDLQHLEDLPESKLSREFLKQAHNFCRYIHENTRAKVVHGGRVATGRSLGALMESYVAAIRNKEVPCIENAVLALAKVENAAAVQEAVQRYDEMVGLMLTELPVQDMTELLAAHARCEEEAVQVFMGRAFRDERQEFQRRLVNQLELKLRELCRRNDQASLDRCQAVLMELYQEVEEKLSSGGYLVPGGYQQFLNDQQSVLERYRLAPDKGPMASKALQDFLASKETTAQSILQADQTLKEKEKDIEVEKARAEASQREAELRREMQERAEQLAREKERSFEEHKQQLMAKMEEDRRVLLANQEQLLSQKLQEQRRLQEEGFQREVSRLQGEIQGLQSQIREQRSSRSRSRCAIS